MNVLTHSIIRLAQGAVKSFKNFPVTIGSGLAFAVVALIRIQLDWPQQEPVNFVFNCLHWSFALGAVFSLAVVTLVQSRFNTSKAFIVANLLGIAATGATFLLLYLFSGSEPDPLVSASYALITNIAAARVGAALLVCFLAFIGFAAYPPEQSDFARSFFMTHKALIIALIYGGVIMAGVSGVAGAVQALLYQEMSEKVYMYIGTLSGFVAFTIFVGYFPDFRRGAAGEQRQIAQKQPRFVEILFGYIMVPILLALTAVLLLWAVKTIFSGMDDAFEQLFAITAAYTLAGLWLHFMVNRYEAAMAKFYCRAYPPAALVILAFEAWALYRQLDASGLKTEEYFFLLVWILTAAAAILLLIRQAKGYTVIIALVCALAVLAVLPGLSYQALPVKAQAERLENLLLSQGMLEGERLIPATIEPEQAVRVAITDAVVFLAYTAEAKLPVWFDPRLGESGVFAEKLGFEQTWSSSEAVAPGNFTVAYLSLPAEAADIGAYRWVVNLGERNKYPAQEIPVQGDKGWYRIFWSTDENDGRPYLRIESADRVLLEEDFNDYIETIRAKFPPGSDASYQPSLADMSLELAGGGISVLLVFESIEINQDAKANTTNYWFNLDALYLREES